FNEMAGQLAEFDKVKEEFVALASHQLRTPATAVKGNLGMLLEGYCGELTAEQQEILNDANQSNERQLTIIDDMLWVARTDSGRLELSKSPTDLSRLASEVVTEQMHTARERKQTITLENPAGELMLELDAQKIRMVFENLLSNASKYTPESGQIKVTLKQESNGAVLAVSDTGVGIAQEDIGKLFSKFSRIANPLSDKVGGTGLGLYLANEIVKLHGGAIRVDSTPGAGTTFTVTLLKVDRRRHSIHRNGVERRR
ncbi:MAG: sensor histidine kinase, partial [Nevskiales bacterium]